MGLKINKQNIVLPMVLAVSLLLFFVVGVFYFAEYAKTQIAQERTSQLVEITSQVQLNLINALDAKWDNLTVAVNTLKMGDFASKEEMMRGIGALERICEMDDGSRLILIDSEGNCYGEDQEYGVWPAFKTLFAERQQHTFIYEEKYWTFIQTLRTPIYTWEDNVFFTHAVLFQDVQTLTQYYNSSAYGNQNETYLLKNDGTRMYDYDQERQLRAYNILDELEAMDGQSCPDIRADLTETGTVGGHFYQEGKEYYYCVTSLEKHDTLLLFLIPAEYVASETVNMVGTMIQTLLFMVIILLLLVVLTVVTVLRQRNSVRIIHQEQANLRRQEEMNVRLEESNTMLVQAKEAAEQAFRIAEEASRAKSSFLFNISHDIRTPMNAIIGFLALLREEADNPEAVLDYSKRIDAASQQLLGLINDVLDMSKIESGNIILSVSEINLAEMIEDINMIIRPQTSEKHQTFDIYVATLTHEYLIGDKLRINQVLINLLSNAMKYTPENGSIRLQVEEIPQENVNYSRIRFTIIDSGIGMSEEYLKIIFDPFTKERTSTLSGIQGSGLGMTITKNLVDLMGGTIRVESQMGKGSTFIVELELSIQEQTKKAFDLEFWRSHGIIRMIVSDSDEKVCHNIIKAMSGTGVAVDYATNGETVVQMIRKAQEMGQPYNLVLLDWKMPDLDGSQTIRLVQTICAEKSPVLLLTAYDWNEVEQEVVENGIDHFMPKPFFMSTFQKVVQQLLDGRNEAKDAEDVNVMQGKHVLVVDDMVVNQMILVKILNTLGASCDTAGNGQEAVEKFETSQPGEYDLILMDVQMPIMDGYAATRAIRSSKHPSAQAMPVIAVTANAFVDDVQDAIESGMDAHIAKPVQIDKLKSTIQQVLDSRRE